MRRVRYAIPRNLWQNPYRYSDSETMAKAIAIVVCAIALLLLVGSFIVPTSTHETLVVNKTWRAWMFLKEDYEVYVCETDTNLETGVTTTTCGPEKHTRTLDQASLNGDAKEDIVFPPLFELRGDDTYNVKRLDTAILYKSGHPNSVSEEEWRENYYVGQECTIGVNMWGFVVREKCGMAQGR